MYLIVSKFGDGYILKNIKHILKIFFVSVNFQIIYNKEFSSISKQSVNMT